MGARHQVGQHQAQAGAAFVGLRRRAPCCKARRRAGSTPGPSSCTRSTPGRGVVHVTRRRAVAQRRCPAGSAARRSAGRHRHRSGAGACTRTSRPSTGSRANSAARSTRCALQLGAAAEQRQQRRHHALQPAGGGAHALQAGLQLRRALAQRHRQLGVDAGQRRAQRVRGVGGEGTLVRHAARQPRRQRVDGVRAPAAARARVGRAQRRPGRAAGRSVASALATAPAAARNS